MSAETLPDEFVELRELACQVFAAVAQGGQPDTSDWSGEGIYWDVANTHARHWPEDKAAQMLSDWRAA